MKTVNLKNILNPTAIIDGIVMNLKKAAWVIGKDAFIILLVIMLLEILVGEYLFYKYVFLAKIQDPQVQTIPTRFQREAYNSILATWEIRSTDFTSAAQQVYKDPFQ